MTLSAVDWTVYNKVTTLFVDLRVAVSWKQLTMETLLLLNDLYEITSLKYAFKDLLSPHVKGDIKFTVCLSVSSETAEQIWLKCCTHGWRSLPDTASRSGDRLRIPPVEPKMYNRGRHCVSLVPNNLLLLLLFFLIIFIFIIIISSINMSNCEWGRAKQ